MSSDKAGRQFWQSVEDDDGAETLSWDELRAAHPEKADESEREWPDIKDFKPQFSMDKNGDLFMLKRSTGGRLKYMGPDQDWAEMDDGGTPAGEF